MYVIKVGGKVLDNNLANVVAGISKVASQNPLVVVHGGGNVVTGFCKRLGG